MSDTKEEKRPPLPDLGAGWNQTKDGNSYVFGTLKVTKALANQLLGAAKQSGSGEASLAFTIRPNSFKEEGSKQPDVKFLGLGTADSVRPV